MRYVLHIIFATVLTTGAHAQDYNRDEWLPRWSDSDGDCQNTRHELLIRYSLAPVAFSDENECRVAGGLWLGPYTGDFFEDSIALDVEHIVPLKWAHEHGGAVWSLVKKRAFAEDPENLWLVDRGRNRSKGARGPDEWMPPYDQVQQVYVRRFMAIVDKYGLEATAEESTQFLALLDE